MAYSIIPGIVNQVSRHRRPVGLGLDPSSASAAVAVGGVTGALIGGAIEGLYVYLVARHLGGVETPKARKTALWVGGISACLGAVLSVALAGTTAAVSSSTSNTTIV